jgi:cell division septation protein DedD
MHRKGVLIAASLAASVVGAFVGMDLGQASRAGACEPDRGPALTSGALAGGQRLGIAAVVGGRSLVVVAGDGRRDAFVLASADAGVIRNVTSRAGSGTAFVLDRRGTDVVVMTTARGQLRLAQPTEARDPSWSSDGRLVWSLGSRLRLWSPDASSTLDIAAPDGAVGVFSPVFASDDTIVSVVAESEAGFTRTEDEGLDNLWRYELGTHRWARLTAFHASGEHWVAIRTPIVRDDGSLEFVLVRGSASATTMPAFELWRVPAGGVPSEVRGLPTEMYLAGSLDGRRIWNIYDDATGEWRLYSETSATTLADLGCGAALVDPRSVPDPDLTPPRLDAAPTTTPSPAPTPTPTPTLTATPTPTPTPTVTSPPTTLPTPTASPTITPSPAGSYISGILVGDFASPEAADAAVENIHASFGDMTPVEVVNSTTAPNIVRPGVWAVVMLVPDGMDPLAALADLRSRLPEYQDWSWVVSV